MATTAAVKPAGQRPMPQVAGAAPAYTTSQFPAYNPSASPRAVRPQAGTVQFEYTATAAPRAIGPMPILSPSPVVRKVSAATPLRVSSTAVKVSAAPITMQKTGVGVSTLSSRTVVQPSPATISLAESKPLLVPKAPAQDTSTVATDSGAGTPIFLLPAVPASILMPEVQEAHQAPAATTRGLPDEEKTEPESKAVYLYLPFQIGGVTILHHEGSNRYRYDPRGLGNKNPLAYRNSQDLEDYHSTTVLNLGEVVGGNVEEIEGGITWLKVDQADCSQADKQSKMQASATTCCSATSFSTLLARIQSGVRRSS